MSLPQDVIAGLTRVAQVPILLVTSDFDGTLAPIVNNPADARPLEASAVALRALAAAPSTSAALISGRALTDLGTLSGLSGAVHLVGSHGAEFNTGFAHQIDGELLQRINAELGAIAERYPGVTVEPKPASVALHVRNADPADGEAALAAARSASTQWNAHATEGKAVLEFAVITTDKGEAIDILREREGADAVVFFGDDVTDEKAFRRLRADDVGVKVGPGETAARYRVSSPEDVATALQFLAGLRR
ncbi:trehalose-phosphatase [Mycolicibacterium mengxianglii]|uniref:trehalose-phosphatase n=1 Tax=Mycolicibacterium mengxianglii TaxID=2736649 RepID=UPI0018D099E8|nr:trehalose-phosphatase [Mycolicibacterium mengxianglii]